MSPMLKLGIAAVAATALLTPRCGEVWPTFSRRPTSMHSYNTDKLWRRSSVHSRQLL
jgi:hypothetical protein